MYEDKSFGEAYIKGLKLKIMRQVGYFYVSQIYATAMTVRPGMGFCLLYEGHPDLDRNSCKSF